MDSQKLFIWIIRGHNFFLRPPEYPFSIFSSRTSNKELICFLFYLLSSIRISERDSRRSKQYFPEKQSEYLGDLIIAVEDTAKGGLTIVYFGNFLLLFLAHPGISNDNIIILLFQNILVSKTERSLKKEEAII